MRYNRNNLLNYKRRQRRHFLASGATGLLAMAGIFMAHESGALTVAINSVGMKSGLSFSTPKQKHPAPQIEIRENHSSTNSSRHRIYDDFDGSKIFKGNAKVIDGDTIKIKGRRIRLYGIDAPESRQSCKKGNGRAYRCGAVTTVSLRKFIRQSQPITCYQKTTDQYGRSVANCFRADGANLASSLVAAGLALDWPKYSGGKYASHQLQARANFKGLWGGKFERPWDYRARR